MPVKAHNTMLSKQFLLSTARPSHPSHRITHTAPPRVMKDTLTTKFGGDIRPFTIRGTIDDINYKEGLKSIHTQSVQDAIQQQENNKVLQAPAPSINASEKTLPRRTRTTLSQLRSGYTPI